MKSAGAQPRTRTHRLSYRARDCAWGYFFIAPLVIGIGVLYIFPFLQSIVFSFSEVNVFNQMKLQGLDNYKKLLTDAEFGQAVGNTFKYVLITVPVQIALATVLAALLNKNLHGRSIYRTLYFLPAVTMPAAIAMVWSWIFNGSFGILNSMLSAFGVAPHSWVSEPASAPYVIMIVGIWMAVGYHMIILLAGLQNIPDTMYEAASIDGAGPVVQFFRITLPLLSPSLFFVMVTSLINAFQVFDVIYMMVPRSSPAFEVCESMIVVFYNQAFNYGNKGYASAVAMVVFLIIMCITILQMKGQKKWVHYV